MCYFILALPISYTCAFRMDLNLNGLACGFTSLSIGLLVTFSIVCCRNDWTALALKASKQEKEKK